MKKTAVLAMILTLIALLLIVGCAQTKPGATNAGQATKASSAGASAAQLVTPTVSTEKSVSTIESDIAGIDSLDQDLDTSDLDSLDKDLNFQI
ncbi:hypothetical protein HZB03_05075 [Candidatus Woesearchaeota archaeon]|nr:hypothetical protein [Candidatus Woesearchaeota archaeon]